MDAIERIHDDFANQRSPFKGEHFPEEQLLDEVDPSNVYERAMVLTAFCTLDYNRNATQLKDNLVELYERNPVYFTPKTFTYKYSEDDLAEEMADIGFRYPNRDARGIAENYRIIAENYGTVNDLMFYVDHDAPSLVERLREDGFLYLKGEKLAPFYARVLSENVRQLDNLWQLDIPVDTHIRRLSKELFSRPMQPVPNDEITDDDIRSEWRRVAGERDVSPAVVDGALWLIGNRWDEWGEDYWNSVT